MYLRAVKGTEAINFKRLWSIFKVLFSFRQTCSFYCVQILYKNFAPLWLQCCSVFSTCKSHSQVLKITSLTVDCSRFRSHRNARFRSLPPRNVCSCSRPSRNVCSCSWSPRTVCIRYSRSSRNLCTRFRPPWNVCSISRPTRNVCTRYRHPVTYVPASDLPGTSVPTSDLPGTSVPNSDLPGTSALAPRVLFIPKIFYVEKIWRICNIKYVYITHIY